MTEGIGSLGDRKIGDPEYYVRTVAAGRPALAMKRAPRRRTRGRLIVESGLTYERGRCHAEHAGFGVVHALQCRHPTIDPGGRHERTPPSEPAPSPIAGRAHR